MKIFRGVKEVCYGNAQVENKCLLMNTFMTFKLAVQEILDLLYSTLLFINDQTELNSLVAKNARCVMES